jgi:N-acetylglutamate synthase-like GNAT family acetyltransferase
LGFLALVGGDEFKLGNEEHVGARVALTPALARDAVKIEAIAVDADFRERGLGRQPI